MLMAAGKDDGTLIYRRIITRPWLSLTNSRLDYCNSVPYGAPATAIDQLRTA